MSDNLSWMNRHAVLLREPQWANIAAKENYKIRADVRPIFDAHPDSLELLDALAERGLFDVGCEFIARMLHRRAAIWWGYGCLLSFLEEKGEVAAGVKAPPELPGMAKVRKLAAKAPFKLPALDGSLENLDNFCKGPDVDYKTLLADYAPPPQDDTAIKAATGAVKAKIAAIDGLIPSAAKKAFEESRARRIAEFARATGGEPRAQLAAAVELAKGSFVNYRVERSESPALKDVLSLPKELEAGRQETLAQLRAALPEKFPATPEAALLLKAEGKKRSDDALQAVWRWIVSPDERNTTLAMAAGNVAAGTPEGLLALTSAWSFGDLAPEGKMTVPVPPELPGTGLKSVLLMLSLAQGGWRKQPERWEHYFNTGMDVVFGKNLWTEAVSEKLSPHAKLEEKFKG